MCHKCLLLACTKASMLKINTWYSFVLLKKKKKKILNLLCVGMCWCYTTTQTSVPITFFLKIRICSIIFVNLNAKALGKPLGVSLNFPVEMVSAFQNDERTFLIPQSASRVHAFYQPMAYIPFLFREVTGRGHLKAKYYK